MIGDNPLMVGVKVPDPAADFEMTESAVLLTLREQQRQKERAEKKRLLYVALTRARDHLFMSGTTPEDFGMSFDLCRSRIEWVFTALGVTGDMIAEGGFTFVLPDGMGSIRLAIVSDSLTIPAEIGRIEPSLLVVPEECAAKDGTWKAPEYAVGPMRVKVVSVSELEMGKGRVPAREPLVSKYLSGVEGTIKGTIIHEVLRGRDAGVVCAEFGLNDSSIILQCEEIAARFYSSELIKRVERSYCEVPFVISYEGRPVTGKIDRLCLLEDGSWIVIEHKSEASADYIALAVEYQFSLLVYVEAARQIMKGSASGYFWFTETGEFFRI